VHDDTIDSKDRVATDGLQSPDGAEVEAKKQGFREKMRGMRDNINRIPQQHRDHTSDQVDRTKRFFTEEYFPPERRDQFIFGGCHKHDDYQASLRWFLDYVEEYAKHVRTIAEHGKDSHQTLTSEAMNELRTLLQRFANGKDMNIMFDAVP
jgi:hypothetical protein